MHDHCPQTHVLEQQSQSPGKLAVKASALTLVSTMSRTSVGLASAVLSVVSSSCSAVQLLVRSTEHLVRRSSDAAQPIVRHVDIVSALC
jgi:hypothetical protein